MAEGSRPTSAQRWSSTAFFRASSGGVAQVCQASVCSAATRIVRCSPPPATSNGSGRCTGGRSQVASVSRNHSPSRLVLCSRSNDRIAATYSANRARRRGRQQLDAVRRVLVRLPAGSQSEGEAAAADVVERRGHLRDDRRVPVGRAEHKGPEPDPGGPRRDSGQHRPALEHRTRSGAALPGVRHEVVADPDTVQADGLRVLRQGQRVGPRPSRVEADAEAHRLTRCGRRAARPARSRPG
jgi:hypothetical protein